MLRGRGGAHWHGAAVEDEVSEEVQSRNVLRVHALVSGPLLQTLAESLQEGGVALGDAWVLHLQLLGAESKNTGSYSDWASLYTQCSHCTCPHPASDVLPPLLP